MDANASYPLVPLSPKQGSLVPVVTTLVAEPDPPDCCEVDLLAMLWHCFCQLTLLLWLALLTIGSLRRQLLELRLQANYWQALHHRAVQREAVLKTQVQHLKAEIRDLKRRLFARKSETTATQTKSKTPKAPNNDKPRSRGQQPGSTGHGRRNHDHLPTIPEDCVLSEAQQCCPDCGAPYEEIPGTADGTILEIEVRAHRRRYRRKRYRQCCSCVEQPGVLTAPPPDKLIPKSNLGISLWVLLLQRKFEFFQPLYRILAELRSHDLDLAAGTITDGLRKLVPVFAPLYELLVEHNRLADHWHCDETRWLVFEKQAGKAGFVWMLWVFAAKESIVFVLDPTRSHDVPEEHFGKDAEGIASVDRYSGYKAMAQVKAGKIILAFCWAHVRRDFLTVYTGWNRNDQRLAVPQDASQFAEAEQRLRAQVKHIEQRCATELAQPDLRPVQHKVLTSLQTHWSGLTVFVDHPEVPMDNNHAERCERGPVVARKNFYGSGAVWSGRLAAMLFSLFQTMHAWGIDVGKWLTAYLTACAKAGGQSPPDPQRYLPWNMTTEERQRLTLTKTQTPADKPPELTPGQPDTSTEDVSPSAFLAAS